ncbi:MAG: radical SAM protein [Leadbetterella sp.]|nr:radical SAM protein [Leadbetterella sp.]
MKFSQFNSVLLYDGTHVLYNSFYQKFITIDPLLKDLLEAAIIEDIDGLEEIHPTFYSYLKAEGYLVPEDMDEIKSVKEIVDRVDNNFDTFLLTINPTMNCNFKCWYCYETHIKASSFQDDMIDRVGHFIEKTASKEGMNFFNLAFFGGEPLLYFKRDVIPVIEKLKMECVKNSVDYSVGFTTNGYLIDDEFLNFFKSCDISPGLQITLDGYKEKHDLVRYVNEKKGSYEVIINNIKKLILNTFHVRLRINYTSENIHDTYKIAEEFLDIPADIKKDYLLIDFHRVWQDTEGEDIVLSVDNNIKKIKALGIPVTHLAPNNVHDSCYADKRNSAVINYNGDLFKCTARDFSTVKRAGYLDETGELIWETGYLEKRMSVKFKNPPCLSCRLLPICNGGCSQHAMEAIEKGDEYCIYKGDDEQKNDAIRSKIREIVDALELK